MHAVVAQVACSPFAQQRFLRCAKRRILAQQKKKAQGLGKLTWFRSRPCDFTCSESRQTGNAVLCVVKDLSVFRQLPRLTKDVATVPLKSTHCPTLDSVVRGTYLRRARSGRTSTGRRRITGGPNYNSPASVRPAAWQRRRGRAGAAASGPVRKLNSAEPHGILAQRGGPGRRAWQARQPATGSALRVHPTQRTRDVRSSARVAGAGQRKTWLL